MSAGAAPTDAGRGAALVAQDGRVPPPPDRSPTLPTAPGLCLVMAKLAAASHLAFVGLLVAGGPIGRRHPRMVPVHLAAVAAAAAINLTGSDCPLTTVEKELLRRAGRTPYTAGFVSHYLVEPVHPAGIDGKVNRVLLAAWVLPTALAYLARGRRAPSRSADLGTTSWSEPGSQGLR